MKILHINYTDIIGGAARAAYRIHHALRESGLDSTMLVKVAKAGDWTVQTLSSQSNRIVSRLQRKVVKRVKSALKTGNPIIHSPALTPSRWVKYINQSDYDIVHLHWVAGEMLSIADIGRIEKPIVWTIHDMWSFCGAEHYTDDFRWKEGYKAGNRPEHESGIDINRWTWNRKRKHWKRPMHIVSPSEWLKKCAKESHLMREWPVHYISYPIDTARWRPIAKKVAREILGLPKDVPLLLFGAQGGGRDPRKGFDLLTEALTHLREPTNKMEVLIFGQTAPRKTNDIGFKTHYSGHLQDDSSLRLLYSAADVFVLPSRLDNQPLTCMEALVCGTPVIAFDNSGAPSMIEHKTNGYLAKAFDTHDLAEGIRQTLEDERSTGRLGNEARKFAEVNFANDVVAQKYIALYEHVLGREN